MPTNLLRDQQKPAARRETRGGGLPRRVLIQVGSIAIRAELLATPTADRIWRALPLYGVAETWGSAIHFETPVETGREPAARATADPGDILFWVEEDRVLIPFGPTPISAPGEIRLPRPCNTWAKSLDDVTPLKDVAPGEKVSVTAA